MPVVSLQNPDDDTWMNQVRAARKKGEPLTVQERERVRKGYAWDDPRGDDGPSRV